MPPEARGAYCPPEDLGPGYLLWGRGYYLEVIGPPECKDYIDPADFDKPLMFCLDPMPPPPPGYSPEEDS